MSSPSSRSKPRRPTRRPEDALADALRRHNQQGTHILHLSVSTGVARYDHRDPCSIAELMERADKLMYAEKQRREVDRGQDLEAT